MVTTLIVARTAREAVTLGRLLAMNPTTFQAVGSADALRGRGTGVVILALDSWRERDDWTDIDHAMVVAEVHGATVLRLGPNWR